MIRETRTGKGKDQVIRREILIGGKPIRLKFTMPIWTRMEDEICVLDDLYTLLHSKGRLKKGGIPAIAALMSGGEFTAEQILAEGDPATMRALIDEITRVAATAMEMKEQRYDDDSVHDETLEEIEKKGPRAD